jgi:hypothetical protein
MNELQMHMNNGIYEPKIIYESAAATSANAMQYQLSFRQNPSP